VHCTTASAPDLLKQFFAYTTCRTMPLEFSFDAHGYVLLTSPTTYYHHHRSMRCPTASRLPAPTWMLPVSHEDFDSRRLSLLDAYLAYRIGRLPEREPWEVSTWFLHLPPTWTLRARRARALSSAATLYAPSSTSLPVRHHRTCGTTLHTSIYAFSVAVCRGHHLYLPYLCSTYFTATLHRRTCLIPCAHLRAAPCGLPPA